MKWTRCVSALLLAPGLVSEAWAAEPVPGNLIVNGGFEDPPGIGAYVCFGTGQSLPGWTIEAGTVEIVGPYWQAAQGKQSLDLNGIFELYGTISQEIPTVPEARYTLRFAFAGNPEGGTPGKSIKVFWEAQELGNLSFDTTGHSFTNMGWVYYEFAVTATSTKTRLRFQSTCTSFCGPAIDDVSVIPTLPGRPSALSTALNRIRSAPPTSLARNADAVPQATAAASATAIPAATNALLQLSLRPVLAVFGTPGATYRIERATELKPDAWAAQTNVVIESSPFLWVDIAPPSPDRQFYRAIPVR